MSEIKPNTQITGESQTNMSQSKITFDSNPNSLSRDCKRPRLDPKLSLVNEGVGPISHPTPNSLGVSEKDEIQEAKLQKIYDLIKESQKQIVLLKEKVSLLESQKKIDDKRKESEYGDLLISTAGIFSTRNGIKLPSKIFDILQFLSRANFKEPNMKKYVLNELKLMTGQTSYWAASWDSALDDEEQMKSISKLDQIFYLFINDSKKLLQGELEVIAQNIYDYHMEPYYKSDMTRLQVLQMICSNPYLEQDLVFLGNISIDDRIQLLTNPAEDIRSVDPYNIINSIIKGWCKNYLTHEISQQEKVKKAIVNHIFLVKDYDKLFDLLGYIAQEDLRKHIQQEIYLKLDGRVFYAQDNITLQLENLANHFLKTHNHSSKKMCNFLFYLNNLWIYLEERARAMGKYEDGAAGSAWYLICGLYGRGSSKLKQTVINILKNIKNIKEDYCSKQIDRICQSHAFNIKNWRQYVQFQDSKEDAANR